VNLFTTLMPYTEALMAAQVAPTLADKATGNSPDDFADD